MEKKKYHYAWLVMIACCAMMATSIGIFLNCMSLFFRPIADNMGVGLASVTLFLSLGTFFKSFLYPFAERLMHRFSWRVVCSIGMIGLCGTFVGVSYVQSLPVLYFLAFLYAAFNTVLNFMAIPIIINEWFKEKAGFAMGVAMACSGFGGMVFNPVCGILISTYDWRFALLTMAIVALVIALPFTLFVLKKPSEKGIEPFGAAEAAAKAAKEAEQAKPVVEEKGLTRAEAYRTVSFWIFFLYGSFLAYFTGFSTQFGAMFADFGVDTVVAATIISINLFGMFIGKILTGTISDKFGPFVASVFCVVLGVFGLAGFYFFADNVIMLYVCAVCFGLASGNYNVLPPLFAKNIFGNKDFSKIFSVLTLGATLIGGATATTVYALIRDLTGGYAGALFLCIGMLVASFIVSVIGMQTGKNLIAKKEEKAKLTA